MKCVSYLGVVVRLNSFRGFNLAHKEEAPKAVKKKWILL